MDDIDATAEHVAEAEAPARLPDLIDFVRSGKHRRVVVERDGKPVAAVISFRDLERFDLLLQRRQRQFARMLEFSKAFEGATDEEVEREALRAVAEVRAEMRAERERDAALVDR